MQAFMLPYQSVHTVRYVLQLFIEESVVVTEYPLWTTYKDELAVDEGGGGCLGICYQAFGRRHTGNF